MQVTPDPRISLLIGRVMYFGESIDQNVVLPGYTTVQLTATAPINKTWLAVVKCDDLLNAAPEIRAGYYTVGRMSRSRCRERGNDILRAHAHLLYRPRARACLRPQGRQRRRDSGEADVRDLRRQSVGRARGRVAARELAAARHAGAGNGAPARDVANVSIKAAAESKQLHKPSDVYRDLVPAVYVANDGAPAFGMFDPVDLANHGKPKVGENGVSEVRITLAKGGGRGENENGQGGGGDPTQLKIAIRTPCRRIDARGEEASRDRSPADPGDDSNEPRGWTLATILDRQGSSSSKTHAERRLGPSTVARTTADFDPKTSVPFVKLNRAGVLRVTVFKKQGDGWQRAGDLRGLVSIEVMK